MSYKHYPDDQYTQASCKVRIDKKYVMTFVQKKSKDGGLFWTAPSIQVTDSGEKKYMAAHMLDSQFENEELMDFIKDSVKRANAPQVAMHSSLGAQQVYSQPNMHQQAAQYNQQAAQFKQEVAADEPLPF
jgi:hypothetical protein